MKFLKLSAKMARGFCVLVAISSVLGFICWNGIRTTRGQISLVAQVKHGMLICQEMHRQEKFFNLIVQVSGRVARPGARFPKKQCRSLDGHKK